MFTLPLRIILIALILFCGAAPLSADNCTEARKAIKNVIASPPADKSESIFRDALSQCPNDPDLYNRIGDYYVHWMTHDIDPEKRAYYNYLATEYFAKGIKSGQGDEITPMKYKLAKLESNIEDITEVGIRSITPYARLNVRVFFEFNSSDLTADAQDQLDVLGNYLSGADASRIILEGHTDMTGPEAYNLELSTERAQSAKEYLINKFNLPPDMVETRGYGFERLADVDHPYGAKNRRVRVRKLPK